MFTDTLPTDYNEVYGIVTSPNDPKTPRYYVKLVGRMRLETHHLDRKIQAAKVHYLFMLIHSEELLAIDIARASMSFSELHSFFTASSNGKIKGYKGKYIASEIEIAEHNDNVLPKITIKNKQEDAEELTKWRVKIWNTINLLKIMSNSAVISDYIVLHPKSKGIIKIKNLADFDNKSLDHFRVTNDEIPCCPDGYRGGVQILYSFYRSQEPFILYNVKFENCLLGMTQHSSSNEEKHKECPDDIFSKWHEFVSGERKAQHYDLAMFFDATLDDGGCYHYGLPMLVFVIEHITENILGTKSKHQQQNIKTFFQDLATENCLGLVCKLLNIDWDGESTESRHDYWKEPKKNALEKDKKELEDENKEGKAGVKFKKCVIEIGNKFNDNIRNVLAHSSEKKYGNDSITKNPWITILTAMMRRYILKVIGATDDASGSFLDEELYPVYEKYAPIPNREYKAKVMKEKMSSITEEQSLPWDMEKP